jgi:uncharacterized protein YjbI with pentapeptide repeats
MELPYLESKTFNKVNFAESTFVASEYEQCKFMHCNFENVNLSESVFVDCEFIHCNLSTAKVIKTALRTCIFKHCKMLGIHFEHCHTFLFAVTFEDCLLNLCSFYKLNLKKTSFTQCGMNEVDFSEASLTEALFSACDLNGATFDQTHLEKADLRTSFNYIIDPDKNYIKKAKFSREGVVGLLGKYDIEIE